MDKRDKGTRLLMLYRNLLYGQIIQKDHYVMDACVTDRTFERDLQTLRNCLSEDFSGDQIVYDHERGGYRLEQVRRLKELSLAEGYILIKMLLHDQALRDDELAGFADTILMFLSSSDQKILKGMITQEILQYTAPRHKQAVLKMIQDLLFIERQQKKICLYYEIGETREIKAIPLGVEYTSGSFLLAIIPEELEAGAFCELSKIRSFSLMNERFAMTDTTRQTMETLRAAIRNGTAEKYMFEEMV